jgi:hypothetical protein
VTPEVANVLKNVAASISGRQGIQMLVTFWKVAKKIQNFIGKPEGNRPHG